MTTIVANGKTTRQVTVARRATVATADGAANVVVDSNPTSASPVVERVRTLSVASPGPQGPQGAPGAGGDAVIIVRTAAQALGGHRIVRAVNGLADYADASVEAHGDDVLGMTLGAAAPGAPVQIITNGSITEPSWNWTPGEPLYLNAQGTISHAEGPDPAFALCIGFAETATTVFIEIQTAIFY